MLDFYCPRLRLAIEIDGDSHFINQDAIDYDIEKQTYIENLGIEFLRFRNEEVFADNDEVINSITQKVKELQKPSPSLSRIEFGTGSFAKGGSLNSPFLKSLCDNPLKVISKEYSAEKSEQMIRTSLFDRSDNLKFYTVL